MNNTPLRRLAARAAGFALGLATLAVVGPRAFASDCPGPRGEVVFLSLESVDVEGSGGPARFDATVSARIRTEWPAGSVLVEYYPTSDTQTGAPAFTEYYGDTRAFSYVADITCGVP